MSNSKVHLSVDVADGYGELEIIDGHFRVLERGFGSLEAQLEPGIYKLRARAGDAHREQLIEIEPDAAPLEMQLDPLHFASPIPLECTVTNSDQHQQAVHEASVGVPIDAGLGSGSALLLSLRDCVYVGQPPHRALQAPAIARAFEGFRLRDTNGELLLDIDAAAQRDMDAGIVLLHAALQPQACVLSYEPEESAPVAMPLMAVAGWQTQVFIHVVLPTNAEQPPRPDLANRAVMMRRLGTPFRGDDPNYRLAEVTRHALMHGRSEVGLDQIKAPFWTNLDDPMLGLFLAHLLLNSGQPRNVLAGLVEKLAALIGDDFPDVFALRAALAHPDGDMTGVPSIERGMPYPPLLRTSWEAIAKHPNLLPPGSATRKAAPCVIPHGSWLSWMPATFAQELLPEEVAPGATVMANVVLAGVTSAHLGRLLLSKDSVVAAIRLLREKSARLIFSRSPPPDDSPITIPIHEKTHLREDAAAALDLIVRLAGQIPWNTVFKRMKSEVAARGLCERMTALQKTLLPTLHLIHMQLVEGDEFTLEDLQELSDALKVPLPVMRDSLEDLVRKMVRFGIVMLTERGNAPHPGPP